MALNCHMVFFFCFAPWFPLYYILIRYILMHPRRFVSVFTGFLRVLLEFYSFRLFLELILSVRLHTWCRRHGVILLAAFMSTQAPSEMVHSSVWCQSAPSENMLPAAFWSRSILSFVFSTADSFELLGTDLAYVEVGCCIISRMLLLLNLSGLIWPSWSLDFAGW